MSYAIPTKDANLVTLSLQEIKREVDFFRSYSRMVSESGMVTYPYLKFNITRIGCGLAGYRDHQIAPMFDNPMPNWILPKEWWEYVL
jgi:hypothetical protein